MKYGIASTEFQLAGDNGASSFRLLSNLGAQEVRMVVYKNNSQTLLDVKKASEEAATHGLDTSVVLIDSPGAIGGLREIKDFRRWAEGVARELGFVRRYVIWNEANSPAFWKGPPALYEALLYSTRQRMKDFHVNLKISGFGLARSHEPLYFMEQVYKTYEERGRGSRLMDELSVHPYPGRGEHSAGPATAFVRRVISKHAQLTTPWPIPINCDEFAVKGNLELQSELYLQMFRNLKTIPQVRSFLTFLLRDGSELDYDSGLYDRNGAPKPIFFKLQHELRGNDGD